MVNSSNFAITEFSEDEMRRPTPYAVPLGSAKAIAGSLARGPNERRIGP
jgi:hypothetical protein